MDVPKLWTVILSGHYDLAKQMISRGANVNETTKTEDDPLTTLLHYAVMINDIQCIRVLANLGANFNARDSKNCTPLHWAVMREDIPDVVEVLINEGAVVDMQDDGQMTPLHYAARNNCIESAKKLIAGGSFIETVDAGGWSALHVAVIYHNVEMIKMLISHGVYIDTKDNQGWTPLLSFFSPRYFMESVKREYTTEIIQLLLDNGADVNTKTYRGIFTLLYAAKYNHPASLDLLLKRGARVNEATNTGLTALHVACENKLAEETALLLEFGANLNACNRKGKTPFELLPNSPSSEATARVVIREAVKREALGQSLCEGYKKMAQSCETYSRFEQECREEIKRMRSEKIDTEDSAISFFYIFSMDEEKLTRLARNEKIITAFESSGYVASFMTYAGELTKKFKPAKKRANFLTSVEDYLGDVLGDTLPAPIVQEIAAYIKYGDIIENEL